MFEIGYPVIVPSGYGLVADIEIINGKYIYTVILHNMTKVKIGKELITQVVTAKKISMLDISKSLTSISSSMDVIDDVINQLKEGKPSPEVYSDLTYAIQQLITAQNHLGDSKC